MSTRTLFLAKLVGLYSLVAAICMITHKQTTVEAVTEILRSAALMLVLGVFTFAAGLAMVLTHNVWSGGALPVVITIVGWLSVMKGLAFLLLSPQTETQVFLANLHYEQNFYFFMAFSIAIGAYLTYFGFASKTQPQS